MTNKHISTEESTNNFHNSTLCINKVSITTTSEDIEEAFIYRDIPIKNLKICTKVDGSSMTLITFNLVNNSDRPELLKGGGSINNKKAVRYYINRDKLLYKCYTCNKIGHLTKNCKLKDKRNDVPSITRQIFLVPVLRQSGRVPIVMATTVLLIGDALQ